MSKTTFIFTSSPLPKDSIALGSFVLDQCNPDQDASPAIQIQPSDISVSKDVNIKAHLNDESRSFFRLKVTRLFSMLFHRENSDSFDISAAVAQKYMLLQPQLMFEKLCEKEETKIWLEKNFKRNPKISFIVGYRTLLNANLSQRESRETEASAQVSLPAGAVIDPTPTGELDFQLGTGLKSTASGEIGYKAIGERIFAICYRRVRFKFHQGVNDGRLLGNSWVSFSKTRGNSASNAEIIEVDIGDGDDIEADFAHISKLETEDGEEIFADLPSEEDDFSEDE